MTDTCRRYGDRQSPSLSGARTLTLVVIATALLALMGCGQSTAHSHAASGSGTRTAGQQTSAVPTQPAAAQATKTCARPPTQQDWISLASTSAADIVAAARKSPLMVTVSSGQGDTVDVSRLGTPLLVRGYLTGPCGPLPDYYAIPARDASEATIGVVLCMLNTQHTAISVGVIVGYPSPRPVGMITILSGQDAINALANQTHVAVKAGDAPELIYFPFDQTAEDTGKINWKAGGNDPSDPMWLIPGADGRDYLVGSDGHVYAPSQLPVRLG